MLIFSPVLSFCTVMVKAWGIMNRPLTKPEPPMAKSLNTETTNCKRLQRKICHLNPWDKGFVGLKELREHL